MSSVGYIDKFILKGYCIESSQSSRKERPMEIFEKYGKDDEGRLVTLENGAAILALCLLVYVVMGYVPQ